MKPAAAPAAPAGPAPVQSAGAPVSAGQEGISELVYGQTTDPFLAEVKRAVESALHYPRKARMFHIEGTAVVQFIVDSNGKLTELKISSRQDIRFWIRLQCGLWQMLSRIGASQKERFGFASLFNSSCKADAKDCRPFIPYLMKSAPLK